MKYFKLFKEQDDCVQACMAHYYSQDKRPGIVVAPTAYGKSIVIAELSKRIRGGLLVLHLSKELLAQNCEKFSGYEIPFSVYSASMNSKEVGSITFGTLKSVKSAVKELKSFGINTVIIDECDRNFSPAKGSEFMKFITSLDPTCVIGLTATPWSLSTNMVGRSVIKMLTDVKNAYYKKFIYVCQIADIVSQNRWTPVEIKAWNYDESFLVYTGDGTNFTEESVVASNEKNLVNRLMAYELKSLLQQGYKRILVFVDSIENAEKFSEWCPKSAVLTDKTSEKERERIVRQFKATDDVFVLFNYGVLSVGFDYPELECVMMGRPTNSLSLFYQIYGRLVRKHPDKVKGLFYDFGGNIDRFGLIEDIEIVHDNRVGYYLRSKSTNRLMSGVTSDSNYTLDEYLSQVNNTFDMIAKVDKDVKFWFGKHKDKPLMRVPVFYLEWWAKSMGSKSSKGEDLSPREISLLNEVNKVINIKRRS